MGNARRRGGGFARTVGAGGKLNKNWQIAGQTVAVMDRFQVTPRDTHGLERTNPDRNNNPASTRKFVRPVSERPQNLKNIRCLVAYLLPLSLSPAGRGRPTCSPWRFLTIRTSRTDNQKPTLCDLETVLRPALERSWPALETSWNRWVVL